MVGRIMIALLIVPILEVWVMSRVASAIGWPVTLVAIVVMSIIGAILVRRQGIGAWNRIQQSLGAGKSPTKELVDGGLIIFGATLLLTPGFLTDAVGFAMLIPATRAPVRAAIMRRAATRAKAMTSDYANARFGRYVTFGNMAGGPGFGPTGPVVDTEGREATVTVHRTDNTKPAIETQDAGE